MTRRKNILEFVIPATFVAGAFLWCYVALSHFAGIFA
jgi:hypothetical protein